MNAEKADLSAKTVTLESSDTGKVVVSSDGVAVSGFTLNTNTIKANNGTMTVDASIIKLG